MAAVAPLAHISLDSPVHPSHDVPHHATPAHATSHWHLTRAQRDVLAGSAGGLVSKVCEYPCDLVKTRLQTQASFASPTVPTPPSAPGAAPAPAPPATPAVGASLKPPALLPAQPAPQGRPFCTTARDVPSVRIAGQYNGALDCFSQTMRDEGVRGLYRGLTMPLQGAILENASLFLTYNAVTQALAPSLAHPDGGVSTVQAALGGGAAGAVVSLFLTPVELVKCQLQVQQAAARLSIARGTLAPGTKLPGPLSIFPSIVRKDGIRGLWLGWSGTLGREAIGDAVWFSTFDVVTRRMCRRRDQGSAPLFSLAGWTRHSAPAPLTGKPKKHTRRDLAATEVAAAGALSGVSYILVSYPIDCVKANVQTSQMVNQHRRPPAVPTTASTSSATLSHHPGFFATARSMYQAQGLRAFSRGLGITAARSAPSSALIFLVYHQLQSLFDRFAW